MTARILTTKTPTSGRVRPTLEGANSEHLHAADDEGYLRVTYEAAYVGIPRAEVADAGPCLMATRTTGIYVGESRTNALT